MKNIRIGNDFVFVWVIERDGQAENLNLATDIVLTLSSCYGTKIITDYTIADGNKLRIEFNPTILDKVADYNLKLSYRVADSQFGDGINDCTVDIYCFSIVPRTALADAADEFASTSDIGVAIRGDSAFRVWQLQAGNEGKTYDDYIAFLQKPATDAAQAMVSNIIALEIRDDMSLYFITPETYSGITFELQNGILIATI